MIHLRILTRKGTFLDQDVESFIIPAHDGPLQIEAGYTPNITACLEAGVMKIKTEGKTKFYALFRGILHVKPTEAILLAEAIEDGYEIDMARAIASRDRNLDIIARNDGNDDVRHARISLAKQLARIQAKELDEGGR
ncbi:MAG: hypothetical protein HUJ60_01065 [Bacilli bacterium]|nr:hypothetical protein [Bacilli bacterium]